MVIGLDGHTLNDSERLGVATYAYYLVKALLNLGKNEEFWIYTKGPLSKWEAENVKIKPVNFKWGWTSWGLSLEFLLRNKPDVMFYMAHSMAKYAPCKNVVAIHDLAFYRFEDYFDAKNLRRLKYISEDSIRRADAIMVPSIATKKDIERYFGKEIGRKAHVCYLGYEKDIFVKQTTDKIAQIKKEYGLKKPYFIYAGALQPRKNIPLLVKAIEEFEDAELVLVGGRSWMEEKTMDSIEKSSAKSRIRRLGYVERSQMPGLFAGSLAFVTPSLYEGFGLPVVEAMASGAPVIYANNSSLPEVAGEAGLAFMDNNLDDLVDKMNKVTKNTKLREELIIKGYNQVKKFSWEKTASETLAVIKEVQGIR